MKYVGSKTVERLLVLNRGGDFIRCLSCEWMKDIEDSRGQTVYLCVNAESPCYLEETGICGFCNIEKEGEQNE